MNEQQKLTEEQMRKIFEDGREFSYEERFGINMDNHPDFIPPSTKEPSKKVDEEIPFTFKTFFADIIEFFFH